MDSAPTDRSTLGYAVVIVLLLVLAYIIYNSYARARDDTITGLWIGTDAFAETVGLETMAVKFGKQLNWRGDRNAYFLMIANPGVPQIVYDGLVRTRIDYGIANAITGKNAVLHLNDTDAEEGKKITDALPAAYDFEIDYVAGRMRWFAQQDGERILFFEGIKQGGLS